MENHQQRNDISELKENIWTAYYQVETEIKKLQNMFNKNIINNCYEEICCLPGCYPKT